MTRQLIDTFGRDITYLRLSVTDRCDLRCTYCMSENMVFLPRRDLLTLEELEQLCSVFIARGVRKIRLTGGEPLVRKGLMGLIRKLAAHLDSGRLDEITLTTNGTQLSKFARDLKKAGIARINLSLDSLDRETFRRLSRRDALEQVLGGVDAALAEGLKIKINTVALKNANADEIPAIMEWAHGLGMDMTLIEVMPMGEIAEDRFDQYLPLSAVRDGLEKDYTLIDTPLRTGGPARYVKVEETGGILGMITPLSQNFCAGCNRVRVTCTGQIYMCLGQSDRVDLRAAIRSPNPEEALNLALDQAMINKPEAHNFRIDKGGAPSCRAICLSRGGRKVKKDVMRLITIAIIQIFCLIFVGTAHAKSFSESVSGLDRRAGFIDIYVNEKSNKIMGLLPNDNADDVLMRAIYTMRLRAGLGSNPVGLDRGWGSGGVIIAFRRFGDKVIIEQENLTYRADPDNPLEARAVDESFADSFLAALAVEATSPDGGVLVDLTDFLSRDGLGLVQHLKDRRQGSFTVAKDRTFIDTKNSFAFPDNVEIDVFLTLTSKEPGNEVATTAASGNDATLIQHHSFVRLPEPGFEPRISDPRMGAMETVYIDYSAPLSGQIERRLALRHRLQKDGTGKTIKPIVFYIDSGAPEPVRGALMDGAGWWKEAFAAAGYPDGFEVRLLPEDVHPLDVRYNVVQWVHRQTRGWSYGGGVTDPRTGEFIKGHVNLGSLRVRQDRMIFEGLAGTGKTGTGADDDPIELALDRIRQLAAHEVGHSLGFAHNFAASSYDKGSVMDYPAPDVRVVDGRLDFSKAYGVGIGPWDKFAAKMIYGDLSPAETEAAYAEAAREGLLYVADSDARGLGTGHPKGAIWDNGQDAVQTLKETLKVREIALSNFDETRIQEGQPRADLAKVLVPIYLYHRYQTAAAGKLIGGMSFDYAVNGEYSSATAIVAAERQREALNAVLQTLEPFRLDLPDNVLALLSPSLVSYSFIDSDREMFKRTAYPAFDLISAADTSAGLTFDVLLDPQRAARLIEFKRRDQRNLGFEDLLTATKRKVMTGRHSGRQTAIAHAVQRRFAYSLMELAKSDRATPAVKAQAHKTLDTLAGDFSRRSSASSTFMRAEIQRFLKRPVPSDSAVTDEPRLPPGSPIGSSGMQYETCWFCD